MNFETRITNYEVELKFFRNTDRWKNYGFSVTVLHLRNIVR